MGAESLRSCPTLCDPMTVAHQTPLSIGVLQARILEWAAMPPSNVWGCVMVSMLLTESACECLKLFVIPITTDERESNVPNVAESS